jgi:tagatose 6-phosphate kinase
VILVVSLNLAIERVVRAFGEVRARDVMRGALLSRHASAKGVNAARALSALSEPLLLLGAVGGPTGDLIERELLAEGIPLAPIRIEGESRTCVVLLEGEGRDQTVINEVGPELTTGEIRAIEETYLGHLGGAERVILNGSLPLGVPASLYGRLIEAARAAGKPALLDASGEPLAEGVRACPDVVKINGSEAAQWSGMGVRDAGSALAAADALVAAGVRVAMVTLGAAGAVLSSGALRYWYEPPAISAVNCVGSGDAALAGLASALRRGDPLDRAGALAVATGTASALHGAGQCSAEEIARILPLVRCNAM